MTVIDTYGILQKNIQGIRNILEMRGRHKLNGNDRKTQVEHSVHSGDFINWQTTYILRC